MNQSNIRKKVMKMLVDGKVSGHIVKLVLFSPQNAHTVLDTLFEISCDLLK